MSTREYRINTDDRIKKFSKQWRVTPFTVFVVLVAKMLSYVCIQRTIVLAGAVANRNPHFAQMLGVTVKPQYYKIDTDKDLGQILTDIKGQINHDIYVYPRARSALSNCVIDLQPNGQDMSLPYNLPAKYCLHVLYALKGGLAFFYANEAFDENTIRLMANCCINLLDSNFSTASRVYLECIPAQIAEVKRLKTHEHCEETSEHLQCL
jgi:hypothetical protein